MTETVTISKVEYEDLLKDRSRLDFIQNRRPYIVQDGLEKGFEITLGGGLILDDCFYHDNIRVGLDAVIDQAVNQLKFYWIEEQTEIYCGYYLEHIVNAQFRDGIDEDIIKQGLYGRLVDDEITKPRDVRDDENGRIYQMSLKDLAVKFFRGEPELLLTSYA